MATISIKCRRSSRAGFSLVETALAMLVAAVGLTAIMALMPAAMDQGKKATDETHAAFFADAVFNSFLSAANSREVKWEELPTYATIPPASINRGQDVMWKDSKDMSVVADDRIYTQRFIAASTSAGLYDHGLRYRLKMVAIARTNDPVVRRRSLELEVWPGEFGTTNNPYRFASELFNHGFN